MEKNLVGTLSVLAAAVICGLVVAGLAVLMAAGGHGWVAVLLSGTAIVTAPAGVAAWMVRGAPHGRTVAMSVVITNLLIDIALLIFTSREGLQSVSETFEHLAAPMILWAVLWLGWQVPPMLALVKQRMRGSLS